MVAVMMRQFICAAILVAMAAVVSGQDSEVIATATGPIQGKILEFEGKKVETFFGIPYAKPPLGDLRFRKPVQVDAWSDVMMTKEFSKPCVQATYIHGENVTIDYKDSSEDCLTINVWKPQGGAEKKPVMVFLYGGAFQYGDSSLFMNDGLPFSALTDVIFVSFNYRVGVFGFLSTRHNDAPGNEGFYDQLLALKWVKQNANKFEGDPEAITLYGHSAGAFSVGLHMYSPLSKGLFKRVIFESGTALSLVTFQMKNEISRFHTLIGLTNCSHSVYSEDKYKETMECLRKADAHDMIDGISHLGLFADMFLPIYDDEFIPIHPLMPEDVEVLNGEEVLIGTVTDEGTLFISTPLQNLLAQGVDTAKTQYKVVPSTIYPRLFDAPFGAIYHNFDQYFENALDSYPDETAYNLIGQTYGDAVFTCPANLFGEFLAKRGHAVYRYQFTHRSSMKLWPAWMGVVHATDLPYMIGSMLTQEKNLEDPRYNYTPEWFRKHKFTAEEVKFSKQLVRMIGHFVKTGKPTIPDSTGEWPRYSAANQKYVNLAPENISIAADGPKRDKCELWRPYLIRKNETMTSSTSTTKKPISFGPMKKAPPKSTKKSKFAKSNNYRKRLEGRYKNDSFSAVLSTYWTFSMIMLMVTAFSLYVRASAC
ncbi:acetylcholinesterase-like [Varroa destructor]|uniref:acetylcholinesterase n=1 Tax=Varroa destructor TaxID=109461 RepID=A0A7M7K9L1_VARDE|nr:acetylcholinesterase-like [Varroa destructor]